MKKIVIFLVCSVFLYGAGLQVATPQVDLVEFKNAQNLVFVESEPVQFTINIPLDLDAPPVGSGSTATAGKIISNEQQLKCFISNGNQSIYYSQAMSVNSGSHTVTMKFNGIPHSEATKITRYNCYIIYRAEQKWVEVFQFQDHLPWDHFTRNISGRFE